MVRNKTRKKIKRLKLLRHESLELCRICEDCDEYRFGACMCVVRFQNTKGRDYLTDLPTGVIAIVGEIDE
jgi:hypothetical protein